MSAINNGNNQLKILVVDDEKNMRITLADILLAESYVVETAASGEEAVALCESQKFDIVLMDVRMPGIDGIEAFRLIRRHCIGVKVIMMSAYSIEDLKKEALDDGAIAFLPKPLDVEKVIKLVNEIKDTGILVVTDENTSKSLHDSLREEGYRVTATSSAHDALELVEQIRFDLIFIDIELHVMNGLDLYLAIKKITPKSIVIMISGKEDEFEEIAREAVRQTAYTFIRKPLDIDYILEMMKTLSSQRVSNQLQKPCLNG